MCSAAARHSNAPGCRAPPPSFKDPWEVGAAQAQLREAAGNAPGPSGPIGVALDADDHADPPAESDAAVPRRGATRWKDTHIFSHFAPKRRQPQLIQVFSDTEDDSPQGAPDPAAHQAEGREVDTMATTTAADEADVGANATNGSDG